MRFFRQRVRHEHEAMGAAAGGGCIVIFRNEFRDGVGEFVAERCAVSWRKQSVISIASAEARSSSAQPIFSDRPA